jgi:DNA-binding IclR family transcriptional regulator
MLASMPDRELKAHLRRRLTAHTEHTMTDVTTLMTELERIRVEGFSTNRQESVEGVTAIGAPVRQGGVEGAPVIAGISIVGPTSRMEPKLTGAAPRIISAAAEIGVGMKRR